jgi:hypothetical protein
VDSIEGVSNLAENPIENKDQFENESPEPQRETPVLEVQLPQFRKTTWLLTIRWV